MTGPTTDHVDNKSIIDGLCGSLIWCIGPKKAKDADLWILIWEEVRRIHQEGTPLEVEKVEAHRSKKEKSEDDPFWNDLRTDELAKDGVVLYEREAAQIRASTVLQKREEVYVALQYAAVCHCLVDGVAQQL